MYASSASGLCPKRSVAHRDVRNRGHEALLMACSAACFHTKARELGEPLAGPGRGDVAIGELGAQPGDGDRIGDEVDLVEHRAWSDAGDRGSARGPASTAVICRRKSGSAASTTWQQQVALDRLDQRAAERCDQMMGELADEADGVGDQRDAALGAHHPPRRRVERGEQPILDEHLGTSERVEQRALARVGVADDRGAELAPPLPRWVSRSRATRLELSLERARCARARAGGRPRAGSRLVRGSRCRRPGARGASTCR